MIRVVSVNAARASARTIGGKSVLTAIGKQPLAGAVAVRALGFFAGHYQGDVCQPAPAYARDLAAELAVENQRDRAELFAGQGI